MKPKAKEGVVLDKKGRPLYVPDSVKREQNRSESFTVWVNRPNWAKRTLITAAALSIGVLAFFGFFIVAGIAAALLVVAMIVQSLKRLLK